MSSTDADLTARARIRNAALAEFADHGFATTTLRAVAARARVSPALVLHHFGSKEGLRAACDEHLLSVMRTAKSEALASGRSPSPAAYLRMNPEFTLQFAYLRRVLLTGGPTADTLFDDMTHDVASYLAVGERAGTVRPSPDPEARAAALTAMGLGAMVFESRLSAHLGGADMLDPAVMARYAGVVMALYTDGLLTGPFTFDDTPQAEES